MSQCQKYVSYYRVSTAKQGKSGLGLEAQKEAVAGYLRSNGGELMAEFTEVESGRRRDRQELNRAIAYARVTRSTLIIAKLDRLARNVSFTAALMDSGLEFVAVDMPQANKFTIHVMAALAEMEAELISARTKAALAEAKRRGVKLGNPRLNELRGDPTKATAARQTMADDHARNYLGLVLEAKEGGAKTLREIADHLNGRGATTAKGHAWHPSTIRRLLDRLGL